MRDHTGNKILPTVKSIAMRYGSIIVDVQSVIKKAVKMDAFSEEIENQLEMRSFQIECKNKYYPSNFTPELVMTIIKDYIASLPYSSRDIFLFNYPAADLRKQDSNELFYPRAADELHAVESELGCIKVFLDINTQPMRTDINDVLIKK